jgi:hypothetical protein
MKQNLKFYLIIGSIVVLIFLLFGTGPSKCECRENYWDPNDKKYGETLSLENTGNLGGMNLTKRKNMYNHYDIMVSFKDLSSSDKELRKKCLDTYKSQTEVMSGDCK